MKITSILLLSIATFFASCSKSYDNLKEGLYADIETAKGNMIVKLEFEKVPNTVANFVTLAEGKNPFVSEEFKGKPFYDGLKAVIQWAMVLVDQAINLKMNFILI